MPVLSIVRQRLRRRIQIARIIRSAKRRYSADPRLNLQVVEQGIAPRPGETADDAVLLRRICDAWSKAMDSQACADEAFQPHEWWAARKAHLEPITRALAAYDFDSLRRAYRNFFRDRCSTGLTGLPLARIETGAPVPNSTKKLHLIDGLHRLDLWKTRTGGQFPLSDLTPPDIGNPFGIVVDGVFVRSGSEDQHYYAHKIIGRLGLSRTPAVAEVGGGFGGMAYYLVRDCPSVTYLDFDLPETIALASYYLLTAFPDMNATLYGEAELNGATMRGSRIVLMPAFAFPKLPDNSVTVAFNSRILSDLSTASLHRYLTEIARTTRNFFLHVNRSEGSLATATWLAKNAPDFELIESGRSAWNDARTVQPDECEYLYQHQ